MGQDSLFSGIEGTVDVTASCPSETLEARHVLLLVFMLQRR
jgi:hypothetical protein